jgi:pimeloyl-ACP methyl ester carboxylesterase
MVSGRTRVVLRRVRRTLIVACLLFLASMPTYVAIAFRPAGFGPEVLASDAHVRVENRADALIFQPASARGDAALMFFPGCPVPAEAYAPLARAIAEQGYPVFVMHVPYRCATLAEQQQDLFAAAQAVLRAWPRRWVLAGHSRGAVHASALVAQYPNLAAGLILIATTHPQDVDLSSLTIPVMKIYGTRDGVAPEERMKANARLLPSATRWVRIEGGNHRQFGSYRYQLWDRSATISRQAQQAQTVEAIVNMLRQTSKSEP